MFRPKTTTAEPSSPPKRRSWLLWLLLLALAGGGYAWFSKDSAPGKEKHGATPILVAPVSHRDVPVMLEGLGTVQAYNTVTVRSQIDGQLQDVLFREGQEVAAGDVLVKIDPRTYQAQLDQALATKAKDEATLANAKVDFARYESLGDSVSAQITDTQRATVRQLEATVKGDQAAIDNARTLLSYTTIVSPISGRTGIRQVDVGNVIHPGDANGLVVITQLKPISVLFSLPQQNLQAINEQLSGATSKLRVIALKNDSNDTLEEGELELVDNQIDQTTGTIKLKATFQNEKELLWPGGFVNVRLLVKTRENAMVVPTVAVQQGATGPYVFVYNSEKNIAELRKIKPAFAEGADTVIDEGLSDGEQVIVDGMAKLQDGAQVKLAEKTPAPAVAGKTSGESKPPKD